MIEIQNRFYLLSAYCVIVSVKHFTCIISCKPHSKYMRYLLLLCSWSAGEEIGLERLINLYNVMHMGSGRTGLKFSTLET